MGTSEEEVMASLGEPRLIAKTLLGMENAETVTEEYVEDETVRDANYRYFNLNGKTIKIPGWLFTILVCVRNFTDYCYSSSFYGVGVVGIITIDFDCIQSSVWVDYQFENACF